MLQHHQNYQLDDALTRIDFALVHHWLANTYWSPGITRERVEQGARHSALVIGVYLNNQQVAFGRVISDTTRFAYIADVYVDATHRGQGLGRALVQFALNHPLFATIDKWLLRTEDAHGVYRSLGFEPMADSEAWMIHIPRRT